MLLAVGGMLAVLVGEGVWAGLAEDEGMAEPALPQALKMSRQRSNAERILECSLRSIACPSRKTPKM
ncbi:hypothetical protein KTAU_12010 [Thermogemmatispora aurantia]|uniref:Uncharacterized protein n=1 Tax=Thermogemmatispora aurantia TaxID=2045279 RepID=A0A5J4K071_9CHLR|nr:hypothetical protein KTAU_12010 [Thermogemmatispora aurantia]